MEELILNANNAERLYDDAIQQEAILNTFDDTTSEIKCI